MKDGTQIPKGYKQAEVGVIPQDWQVIDMLQLCTLQRGFDITEITRVPGTVPVYSSSGISYYHNKAMINPPGVVTGRKGLLGKVFLINEPFWPHDTTLWVKDFRGNDPAFVALVLQHFHLERLDAATSVPTLNRNNLSGYRVAIPATKAEQEAIAGALSDADALIESLEQLLTKKRQLKQGSVQQLLTGITRLPGFSGEWEAKRLGRLGVFVKGKGVTREQSISGSLACVRYGEIYTQHNDYIRMFHSWISRDVASTATLLKQGDILFAGSGETKDEIGKCVALVDDVEAYAGGDIVILRSEDADPLFLGYYLNTAPINQQKASRGQGDAVVHIGAAALADIQGTFPPLAEQTAIAAILSDIDAEITALEDKLAKACNLKQGMMQELLTGRTRLV
ncbi:restriction endonuclease subunit S [Candidatus Thiodictyon syntrophicum]|jgi:type I restriction enzyme S subunit|uniref:Type I restriction modification DNA specificity domain-containing protein n=1 Tax=Candidatus Thiodictyon syntrophicum TaxID=1166950 RepID=A0A2K8UC21_9GAMM|nr:restriction endonuclease subunit S [Candidatus Thiodictyon syntrophicum]AUB83140.1 hypothetical protein THSYN_20800 [Candidatus Thiodictyon syntrophicum]